MRVELSRSPATSLLLLGFFAFSCAGSSRSPAVLTALHSLWCECVAGDGAAYCGDSLSIGAPPILVKFPAQWDLPVHTQDPLGDMGELSQEEIAMLSEVQRHLQVGVSCLLLYCAYMYFVLPSSCLPFLILLPITVLRAEEVPPLWLPSLISHSLPSFLSALHSLQARCAEDPPLLRTHTRTVPHSILNGVVNVHVQLYNLPPRANTCCTPPAGPP